MSEDYMKEYTKLQQQYEYFRKVAMTYMYTCKDSYERNMAAVEKIRLQIVGLQAQNLRSIFE